METFQRRSSDEINESSQSPVPFRLLTRPLSPVSEDSPVRRPPVKILWDTSSTPVREKKRMVGSNSRKFSRSKSSSEIQQQHEGKKAKRYKSDVDRVEEFRKSLLELCEMQERAKNENMDISFNDSFDIDWEAVEADAEKRLSQLSVINRQKSTDTEEYENFILALPDELDAESSEPVNSNLEVINDQPMPSTSIKSQLSPQTNSVIPKKRDDDEGPSSVSSEQSKQQFASKKEIEQKRLEAIRRREESLKKLKGESSKSSTTAETTRETKEEIQMRIEKNRLEALKRLQQTKAQCSNKCETPKVNEVPTVSEIPNNEKVSPSNNSSAPSNSTKPETQDEIKQRIEKNRQEALRRLQQNKAQCSKSETPKVNEVPTISEIPNNEMVLSSTNSSAPSNSTKPETQEEIKQRIEKNRQEALRRLQQNKILVVNTIDNSKTDDKIPSVPTDNPSTSASVTKTETQEEIKQRIERNRKEALLKLKQNGLIPPGKGNILIDSSTKASSSNSSALMQRNLPEIPKSTSEVTKIDSDKENFGFHQGNSAMPTTSSSTLSEEAKRKIEEKRLEAIKRREIWLKNQKGSN